MVFLFSVPFPMLAAPVEKDMKIIITDRLVISDVLPYIHEDRTFVPIRFISEELGFDVTWDGAEKKITISKEDNKVKLQIGSTTMKVNDKEVKLEAPAALAKDRTFVPLRAISEAFGLKVDYNKDLDGVFVGENPNYNTFHKVVYYRGNEKPVTSKYTFNLVTKEAKAED